MVKLEYSEILGRKIRSDDWDELGISTWIKIKEALGDKRLGEAESLVDYVHIEGKFGEFYFNQVLQLFPEKIRPEHRKGFKAYDGLNNIFNYCARISNSGTTLESHILN